MVFIFQMSHERRYSVIRKLASPCETSINFLYVSARFSLSACSKRSVPLYFLESSSTFFLYSDSPIKRVISGISMLRNFGYISFGMSLLFIALTRAAIYAYLEPSEIPMFYFTQRVYQKPVSVSARLHLLKSCHT